MREKEQSKLDQAVQRCFDLLSRLGPQSPRYEKVFNVNDAQKEGIRRLQATAFLGGFRSQQGLDSARRRFEAYIGAMSGLGIDPFAPTEWETASFINDQCNRGHSGPNNML